MIIAGDIALGEKQGYFYTNKTMILANLEGPILPHDLEFQPTKKAGPNIFSTYMPTGNKSYVFAMANNHIMDFGDDGLETTLSYLKQRKIKIVGAGKNISEARNPVIVTDNGTSIGVISCCEAQFGIGRRNKPGVAEIGPWIYKTIERLKREVDAVIVSSHAALEVSPWPSPRIQEFYRSLIDSGATVVHGHHSHVPQGFEQYGQGLIFYGMGNFMVNPDMWRDRSNSLWSIGAEIDLKSTPVKAQLLIFEIQSLGSDKVLVEITIGEEQNQHKNYLETCNRPLKDQELLEALWQETSVRAYYKYGARYMNFPETSFKREIGMIERLRCIRDEFRKFPNIIFGVNSSKKPSRQDYLLWHVMFACESHRDAIATALGVLSGEIKDLRTAETKQLADEMLNWGVQ